MDTPRWYLRVRHHPERLFCTVHLVRQDGAAHDALLWGEVLPALAAQIAEITHLPCEVEEQPLTGATPRTPPGCLPVARQGSLFDAPAPGYDHEEG